MLTHVDLQLASTMTSDYICHIVWCATGPLAFLPLHAAGIYGSSDSTLNINLLDHTTSSYTPTIASLLIDSVDHSELPFTVPRTLLISQPDTPGQKYLPGTTRETESIQKIIPAECINHLNAEDATVSTVIESMEHCQWVHLACHGIQNEMDPLQSAFILYDGKLTLGRLMAMKLKNVKLAFLSACQTATGDQKLPEEAVNLAAGMLVAGFTSVVGTLWSIEDRDGSILAEAFYSRLIGNSQCLERQDGRLRVAYALHEAVKELRDKVGVHNFARWVPFVHFGV